MVDNSHTKKDGTKYEQQARDVFLKWRFRNSTIFGAGLVALEMAGEKALNAGTGKRVATEKFTYTNSNGELITKQVGEEFNLKSIPEDQRDLAKASSRVQDTRVTKMVKGTGEALVETADNLKSHFSTPASGSNKTPNETTNSSTNQNNSNTDSKVSNKPQHEDLLKNNITNSTTSGEKVKGFARREDGLYVPDDFEVPKEPHPHIDNVGKGNSLWKKAFGTAAEFGGKVLKHAPGIVAGYEINEGYQDVLSGRKDVSTSIGDTINRIGDDSTFGTWTLAQEAIKGDEKALNSLVTAPTNIISIRI